MKRSWGKLGFVPPTLPWEQPDADLLDRLVFGPAEQQHGAAFALRMWAHTCAIVQIERDYPDDNEASAVIAEYLAELDSRDATEFAVFNRQARRACTSFLNRGAPGRACTLGLLPFGEPLYGPPSDLPF